VLYYNIMINNNELIKKLEEVLNEIPLEQYGSARYGKNFNCPELEIRKLLVNAIIKLGKLESISLFSHSVLNS